MRTTTFALLLLTAISGCTLLWPDRGSNLRFDGTVEYITIEGGGWVIEADDGTTYEPINLGEAYRDEGLRVRVWADRRDDLASVLQVGPIIEIERILVLDDPNDALVLLDEPSDVQNLDTDPASVLSASLDGRILEITVQYSGGCKPHSFTLYGTGEFAETDPPSTDVFLVHDANGDDCEAAPSEHLAFDVEALLDLYEQFYPGGEGFTIRIHEPVEDGEFELAAPDAPFYEL